MFAPNKFNPMGNKLSVSVVNLHNMNLNKIVVVSETDQNQKVEELFVCDKKYLWKAIAFSRSDESNELMTDMVASLRIVRDSTTDHQALAILNKQIMGIENYLDTIEKEYRSLKSLTK